MHVSYKFLQVYILQQGCENNKKRENLPTINKVKKEKNERKKERDGWLSSMHVEALGKVKPLY